MTTGNQAARSVGWMIAGIFCVGVATGAGRAAAAAGEPIVFNPDSSWCWFQDERAIIDNGQLLLAGVSSQGDITVTAHDLETGETAVHVLHARLQANDHAVPALMVLPDGRYFASYSKHGSDHFTRWRISEHPGDASRWQPEQQFDHGARVTYSNLYRMAAEGQEGRIYNFIRSFNWDPNFIVSDDHGASWRTGGRLIDGGPGFTRPYVRYTGNGADTIHFITTEEHPNRYPNSIYHGYLRGGKAYRSDGTLVNEDIYRIDAPPARAFTRVFEGDGKNVAWTSDIQLDGEGNPYIAFISADADPDSGDPIMVDGERRYEIFQGVTGDGGQTWRWTPVTRSSSQDNLRPLVAARGDTWAVVWLRGEYRTYTDYRQAAVGRIYRGLPE